MFILKKLIDCVFLDSFTESRNLNPKTPTITFTRSVPTGDWSNRIAPTNMFSISFSRKSSSRCGGSVSARSFCLRDSPTQYHIYS